MKKLLLTIIIIMCLACSLAFSGCDISGQTGGGTTSIQISNDGYWVINGEKTEYKAVGIDGAAGQDGRTPTIEISNDGYWVINGEKTEYKAVGTDGETGQDGKTPTIEISDDGYWVINGEKTEHKAVGNDGQDGIDGVDGSNGNDGKAPTIEISDDGYWVINGVKTEYKAVGTDGETGQDGRTPTIEISNDGYWVINGEKTEYKAVGTDGETGQDGKAPTIEISDDGYWVINGEKTEHKAVGNDGQDGVGIKSVEFDEQGRLVITLTDDTVLPPIEIPKPQEHEHTFGEWLIFNQSENISCDQKMFYHVCSDCNYMEFKHGSYEDHDWQENYLSDSDYHWIACNKCDEIKDKGEHSADESGYCGFCDYICGTTVGVVYQLSSDSTCAEVIGYEGSSDRIILASEYQGLPVKSVAAEAFKGASITSILIPETVTTIGDSAFFNCSSLTDIVIPESVTEISAYAFTGCNQELFTIEDNLKYLRANDNPYYLLMRFSDASVSEYSINSETKFICESAFSGHTTLTNIEIPSGVTVIGSYAFYNCSALENVEIPTSVTTIGNSVLYGCASLQTVSYRGTAEEWNNISTGSNNGIILSDTILYSDVIYTYLGGSLTSTSAVLSNFGNGESITVYCTLNYTIYYPTQIEILGDGANYVTINQNSIQAIPKTIGEANVRVTYDINGVVKVAEYTISVEGEVYSGNAIMYSSLDGTLYFDNALTEVGIVSVVNGADKTVYYIDGEVTENVPKNLNSKVLADNTVGCVITLSNGEGYSIDLVSYTKVIDEDDDFTVFHSTSGATINGYYIMANDIVLDGSWTGNASESSRVARVTFKGVFDGNGHVAEIALNRYGVFGKTDGAEIKNAAFIVKQIGNKNSAYASILAYQMANTKVSDCYFMYDLPKGTSIDVGYYGYAQSAGLGLYATTGNNVEFSNVVIDASKVEMSAVTYSQPYSFGSIISKAKLNSGEDVLQPVTNNVYVLSSDKYLGYLASVTASVNRITAFNGIDTALFASNDTSAYEECQAINKAQLTGSYRYDNMAAAIMLGERFNGLIGSESNIWSLGNNCELLFNGTTVGVFEEYEFISDSASEYAIVIPDSLKLTDTSALAYAVNDLHDYVSLSTNGSVDLPIIKASSFNANTYPKYFSIGDTGLMSADVSSITETLGPDGLFCFSENDDVYFTGNSNYGVANGIYDFLRTYLGFEAVTDNVVLYDENVTDVAFNTLYKIRIPDIEQRHINGVNEKTRARYGARSGYMGYGIGGLYTDLNCTAWEIPAMHNTLDYIPYSVHKAEHGAYWYATNENNEIIGGSTPKDICYTAHGDEQQYEAMVAEYVARIKQIFKQREELKVKQAQGKISWANTTWDTLTIMTEDNGTVCKCNTCLQAKEKYGGYVTGALIVFLNRVRAGVDEWFETTEGKAYKIDNFKLMFSAYQGYIDAPVIYDEELGGYAPVHEDVILSKGVTLQIGTSASSGLIPYYSINAEENAKGKATIEKWALLVDGINLWTYQANFSNYLYFGDTFELFNEEGYTFFAENKVKAWVNQNSNGKETSWALLKEYVSSKLMWDTTADLEEIYDTYFDAVYGSASQAMRNLFDLQREAFHDALDSYAAANTDENVAGYDNIFNGYYDDAKLDTIINGYREVIASVEEGSPEYYQILKEAISPYFIALTNHNRYGALGEYGKTIKDAIKMDEAELARVQTLKVEFKQMIDAYEAKIGTKMHRTEHSDVLSEDYVYNQLGYIFRPSNVPLSLVIFAVDMDEPNKAGTRIGGSTKTLTAGKHSIGWNYGYPDGNGNGSHDYRNLTIEVISGSDVVELTLGYDADGNALKWNGKTYINSDGCLAATQALSCRFQLGVLDCKQAGTAVIRLHYDLDGMHYTYDLTVTVTA